jgi:hypothetical protein
MYISNITHFLDKNGNIPDDMNKEARQMSAFLCLVIDAATKLYPVTDKETEIRCFKKGCHGKIHVILKDIFQDIQWKCPSCKNEGRISEWIQTRWNNIKFNDSDDEFNIKEHLKEIIGRYNFKGQADFEEPTPAEIYDLLYTPFGEKSPVKIQRLQNYSGIPILVQIKFLLNYIVLNGDMKLTAIGNFPVSFVREIYRLGYLKDYYIEHGLVKLKKESDSLSLSLTRQLAEVSGLVKKRKNKFSITKKAEKLLNDDHQLLVHILKSFGSVLNWAYFDGYGEQGIGQMGFAFSLVLLNKYGNELRDDNFYAEKYFKAFPMFLDESFVSLYGDFTKYGKSCYCYRTFELFLYHFGLIQIVKKDSFFMNFKVHKTEIFDLLFKIEPLPVDDSQEVF